ncbi:hypothetical protein [Sporosarcina sp. Te-1]|uniref:hypothetical protein n=1 Tax=Sporosarcina sp. Te-1 TaxID=2818390 RepID=UPI001A9D2C09|nr:hypothetical protein [Sporosarcina sp. Te-1]QTD41690.1 hypothetical protein J3U78_02210 [Sporosarcina sp. Te-1]
MDNIVLLLLIVGIICVLLSFLFGRSSHKQADEIENISISLHQETNQLKKRLKAVEEELMIGVSHVNPSNVVKTKTKPVHEIIVNQILSLHAQGYSIADISKRSSLSTEEVSEVLRVRGAR